MVTSAPSVPAVTRIRPSAPTPRAPVAERDGVLGRHRVGAREVEQDEEVVAQAVVLGEAHAAISLRAAARASTRRLASSCSSLGRRAT